ncbi:hypothetical protein QUF58_06315 [Anaerolineales bacterium HSG24]|nr:hypothetical protein [Anaerolineales bacterium HSG24]
MTNKPNKPSSQDYLRVVGLILGMTSLWAIGGLMAGLALETVGFNSHPLSIGCASVNVLIGLFLFKDITREPKTERYFFEHGPFGDLQHPTVGCLWMFPLLLLILGTSMWFWATLLNAIFPE